MFKTPSTELKTIAHLNITYINTVPNDSCNPATSISRPRTMVESSDHTDAAADHVVELSGVRAGWRLLIGTDSSRSSCTNASFHIGSPLCKI